MLTIDEFKRREAACRLTKPNLFRLAQPDPPASVSQIEALERAIGCRLPQSYKQFLAATGGGDYPFVNVFSADPDSAYYLPVRAKELQSLIEMNLLPFHDDQAGGFYVLKITAGAASEAVYYWDWETRELSNQKYESVLDFVADRVFT